MTLKDVFGKVAGYFANGGPLAWRRDFAALLTEVEKQAGVEIVGHTARPTPTGVSFTPTLPPEPTAWKVTPNGAIGFSVGTGCVRVGGLVAPYIVEEDLVNGGTGWLCIEVIARPVMASGAGALPNGMTGEMELQSGSVPVVVFVREGDARGLTHCEPDYLMADCEFTPLRVPFAFVDAGSGRIFQLIGVGIVMGFGITNSTRNIGPDVSFRTV